MTARAIAACSSFVVFSVSFVQNDRSINRQTSVRATSDGGWDGTGHGDAGDNTGEDGRKGGLTESGAGGIESVQPALPSLSREPSPPRAVRRVKVAKHEDTCTSPLSLKRHTQGGIPFTHTARTG